MRPPERRRTNGTNADEEEEKTESEEGEDGGDRPNDRAEPGWRRRAGQSNARTFGPARRITAAASPTFRRSPVKNGMNPT